MLDVYRSYYGLSGEPFRLGPDYRFSLHHTSYAHAKAYLDYAIYQGEGFIVITGAPGTGKTTLISEILATLDRTRVQVATLTSTQLESRDLLHMVASAFGLQLERFEKAELLLQIEAFLLKRTRSGGRVMLIVDEAQGLSSTALEELRLLANLQYQHQLLLQICLVGQDRLLELIHSPGMEHLLQRLVAATTLEPLGFDETIDYIEHRLGKVDWNGDPALDEAALRLVFSYSGGVPRRINLIVNRLFLYGGMEQKHKLTGADAQNVITGLVEEHLVAAQPLIDDSAIGPPQPAPGRKAKARSLPRSDVPLGKAAKASTGGGRPAGGQSAPEREKPSRSATDSFRLDDESLPGSRRPARPGDDGPTRRTAPSEEPTRQRSRQPSFATRGPEPPLEEILAPRRPHVDESEKDSGSKIPFLLVLLLAGAAAAYLLGNPHLVDRLYQAVDHKTEIDTPAAVSSGQAVSGDAADSAPVATGSGDEPAAVEESAVPQESSGSGKGVIVRQQGMDEAEAPASGEPPVIAAAHTETGSSEPQADHTDTVPADSSGPDIDGQVDQTRTQVPVARASTPAVPPLAEAGGREGTPAAAATAATSDITPPDRPVVPPAGDAAAVEARSTKPESTAQTTANVAPAPGPVTPVQAPAPVQKAPAPVEKTAAPVQTAAPVEKTPAPVQKASAAPGSDAIATRREQLQEAAERRFSRQLAQLQSNVAAVPAAPVAAPARVAPAVSATPALPVLASQPKTSLPEPQKKTTGTSVDSIKTMLLDGRWNSGTSPATLLPSETTFCSAKSGGIHCVSVPQEVKTQYGPAHYKVESDLSGFSEEGLFEMSYRTLVRLVGADTSDTDWQVTEYSMSCKLAGADRVSCLDGKGITREYRRLPR